MARDLKKELNLLDIFCLSTGAMISSGLFIIPGIAFAKAGPAVVLYYKIAGVFCLPTLFSMSELTTAMPKAGGAYFYITRGFGPLFGTVAGFSIWFSLCLKGSFALVGMGTYLSEITLMPSSVIALICGIVFVLLNLISTKDAGRFQSLIVILMLFILFAYVIWGSASFKSSNLTPFFSTGLTPVFTTASFVFISYGGLVKAAALAEEAKNPSRDLPLGMILSLAITTVIFFMVVLVTVGVSEPESLKTSLTPISDGAALFGGNILVISIGIAAFFAFVSTANSCIMTASRYPLGMSRDKLLPKNFQNLSTKFGTPYISIIFTGLIMVILVNIPLELLVKIASSLLILLNIFTNLTVILFRESKIASYKPVFRSSLYPYMQIAGILGAGFLLIEMGSFIVFLTLLFLVFGYVWYTLYAKKRSHKDSALIYVLEQLVSKDKELASDNILTELKDIVIQRDDVLRDRVHHLFEESEILDIEDNPSMEEFFVRVADTLGGELETEAKILVDKFIKREMEASTVIKKGLAIPHIIIDGNNIFKIVLARAKNGVIFSDDNLAHMIFITVGSGDTRSLHLKVLAAIAEITQDEEFESKWLEVSNKEELRNLVLLAERKRGI